jgi:hypothetical protein
MSVYAFKFLEEKEDEIGIPEFDIPMILPININTPEGNKPPTKPLYSPSKSISADSDKKSDLIDETSESLLMP